MPPHTATTPPPHPALPPGRRHAPPRLPAPLSPSQAAASDEDLLTELLRRLDAASARGRARARWALLPVVEKQKARESSLSVEGLLARATEYLAAAGVTDEVCT